MSYYGSNYPSNSGPPPPPGAPGGYGAYPRNPAYGGTFNPYGNPYAGSPYAQPSAYNVNQYPAFGGQPPPPAAAPYGSYNYGYPTPGYGAPAPPPPGAVPGFTVPQYSGPQAAGGGAGMPPPAAPPPSMLYNNMQNMMSDISNQQTQWKNYQKMGLIDDSDDDEVEIRKMQRRKSRKHTRELFDDEEEEENEEEKEEEKRRMEEKLARAEARAKELQDKLSNNDGLKEELRVKFIDELMRRQGVSGTFEDTQGTVFPYMVYEADDPVTVWHTKSEGENIEGQRWDASVDSMYLRKAMRGLGTDEKAIINVISTRSRDQRNRCMLEYKTCYGRDLIKDLKSELSGDFRTSIIACFETPARYDAYECKRAIYGAGTDEEALIEILMTRTNEQIKELVAEYNKITYESQRDPNSSLEKDIIDDTSGDFKRLLISAAQGNRRLVQRENLEEAVEEVENNGVWTGMFRINYNKLVNMARCKKMAEDLYKAGEKKIGTDEETFNRIFSTQDYYSLRVVWDEYVKISQRDILNSVSRETSGDFKHGLQAIAQNIKCRPMFFADRLYKAMKGAGTNDSTLIRIVMSRSEIDMVQIKACFLQKYNQTLWNFIKDDTSGDYRRLLLAIVGKN